MNEGKQPTILILEDDLGVARLQQHHLERAGYSVKVTGTPAEAMAHIERNGAELLLLDYRLPGQATGLDFYAHLKTSGQDLPVILVTGFSDDATVVKALRTVFAISSPSLRNTSTISPKPFVACSNRFTPNGNCPSRTRRLAAVINSALDAVITVGADGAVSLFNPAAEELFRCPNSAAMGQPIHRFIPKFSFLASGNEHAKDPGSEGLDEKSLPEELRGVRADGEEFLLEASVTHAVVTGQPCSPSSSATLPSETGRRGKTAK